MLFVSSLFPGHFPTARQSPSALRLLKVQVEKCANSGWKKNGAGSYRQSEFFLKLEFCPLCRASSEWAPFLGLQYAASLEFDQYGGYRTPIQCPRVTLLTASAPSRNR